MKIEKIRTEFGILLKLEKGNSLKFLSLEK